MSTTKTKTQTAIKKTTKSSPVMDLKEAQRAILESAATQQRSKGKKSRCKAARHFQVSSDVVRAVLEGRPVFIHHRTNPKKPGVIDFVAYTCCSMSCEGDGDYCRSHKKQDPSRRVDFGSMEENEDYVAVSRVEEKDPISGETKWGLPPHRYFDRLRDRKNILLAVMKIINGNDPEMKQKLETFANMLLDHKSGAEKGAASSTVYHIHPTTSYTSLFAPAPQADEDEEAEEDTSSKATVKAPPSPEESEDEAEEDTSSKATVKAPPSPEESEAEAEESGEESEEESDEEDDEPDDEITTVDGATYGLYTEEMQVVDLEEEKIIGRLTEIPEAFHKVVYEGKKYTVTKNIRHGERQLTLCVLTNRIFDPETQKHVANFKVVRGAPEIEYIKEKKVSKKASSSSA